MTATGQGSTTFESLDWLGWPLDRRRAYFKEQARTSNATYPVEFQASLQNLRVLKVPIELPKYRLVNGRTASLQQEYLARHPGTDQLFFGNDPERLDVQQVQHQLLTEILKGAGLKNKFEDEAVIQNQPIILDEFGFVINGNRRLCQWRNLYRADSAKWIRYSHIQVVVLPHADDKEIDRLEAALQVDADIREDYVWHSLANMMRHRQRAHSLTDDDLARLYNRRPSDIRELFDMLDYASEYLRSRGYENQWSRVNRTDEAFRKIVERRRSLASTGEKELFKEAAFALIDNGEEVGRLYAAIPDIQKYLDNIKTELRKSFQMTGATAPDSDDLLGDTSSAVEDVRLAAALSRDEGARRQARDVIRDVIEAQRSLEKDAKSAEYLLKLVLKANSLLETAVANLRPEVNKPGVADQLDQLEDKITRIRKWLRA